MKRIWRKILLLAAAAAMTVLLTGCLSASTVEDLFTLPQPPIEYTDLADTIGALISDGYEYASPSAGQNIQAVQLVDLNSDGRNEAVAFFRRSSDEKPLKIMIFEWRSGAYELLTTIESSGSAIERISYEDMNVDGVRELVVGWKISSDVQNVAVYALGKEQTMLMQSNYTRYSIQEMDGDGVPSLLVFRADAQGNSVAEFYGWRTDAMTLVYHCALSSTMAALSGGSVVPGMLDEDTPAVFVTGVNEEGMAVTDILACRDNGTLTNAALSGVTGLSGLILPYRQLQPQDINGDGIIEIPSPAVMQDGGKQNDGLVDWLHCDINGQIWRETTTYHCQSAGWYFMVPEDWVGNVAVEAVDSGMNESEVLLVVNENPTVAVYAITGENRENRAMRGNRKVLRRQTDIVYAGEVMENNLDFTMEDLRLNFRLIVSSWGK